MPRVKKSTSADAGRQRVWNVRKGAKMSKSQVVNTCLTSGKNRADRIAFASMDLDEMLEASNIVEMGLRGEEIPVVKSPKAQAYARIILRLNETPATRMKAEKMQQALTVQIVKRNKKTTDKEKSKRLYQAFMGEE